MAGAAEQMSQICWAESKEMLESFVASQLAPEPYQEKSEHWLHGENYSWSKSFKKGSPVEWFNAPDENSFWGQNYLSLDEEFEVFLSEAVRQWVWNAAEEESIIDVVSNCLLRYRSQVDELKSLIPHVNEVASGVIDLKDVEDAAIDESRQKVEKTRAKQIEELAWLF